jgi:hypothetical protein
MTAQAFLNDRVLARKTASWSVLAANADFQHSRQLDQLGLVLIGVMLAEQQLSSGRQLGTDASRRTAAIAAVSPGQFRTGKRCVHGVSVLA